MSTTETGVLLQAALHYAGLGWPVLPLHTPREGVCDCARKTDCVSPGKHPRTLKGLDDASRDETTIRRWWSMWPQANVAIDLGGAGLVDIAPDSLEWHAEFIAQGLPDTLTFVSGGGDGHVHYLYTRPPGTPCLRICESGKFDILSAGYAVVPPSLHTSGRRYRWT